MKKIQTIIACLLLYTSAQSQLIETGKATATHFQLENVTICYDSSEASLVRLSARLLQKDIEAVTGNLPALSYTIPASAKTVIIIGSPSKSPSLQLLEQKKMLHTASFSKQWEGYTIKTISNPFKGVTNAIVITGSDRRGIAYGVFELSRQLGVSPWYWWADVPTARQPAVYVKKNALLSDTPKVKYRGIFINDEAPALSGWSKEKFGGFNHAFYAKVFELILRLKGNYIWPAMWGNAFYDDDSLNIQTADEYGIVIGTSHHEPLMRAHDEWRRYGKAKWNYDSNEVKLKAFWQGGMERSWNEKVVTVGMRGDGDEPMSRETATTLLEKIVTDQRAIIADVTGKPASQTPQLWALYKEVQDYYDKGMRVPDDVTLLLCDDNWGNIRRLPKPGDAPRKGGYGIYYHFDYVGGPRNYKWLNTNPLPRIWEQMHLAWEYKARDIWIVNVGDIKPMEFPISFFLDYAWNPDAIGATDIKAYTEKWAAAQFGKQYSKEIGNLLSTYSKYNGRRKPELLDANTYSFNYGEWDTVVNDYNKLLTKATLINNQLPPASRDAYFQLVLHPIQACANLYELYYYTALNKKAYSEKSARTNEYADKVKACYQRDSLITVAYHSLGNGKWNQMMSQTHIGYTGWQQPARQRMPVVKYLPADSVVEKSATSLKDVIAINIPANHAPNSFYEDEESGVSINADHFTSAINANGISWQILPDHGRTGSAVTTMPVTAPQQKPGGKSPHLEYEFYTFSQGPFTANAYFSPSLNFQNNPEGLQYGVSVDDEAPQLLSLNKEDKNSGSGIWNKWAGENIIIKTSHHTLLQPGKHVLKYWVADPAVVLQKLVLDFGNLKPSYLGPPETIVQTSKK